MLGFELKAININVKINEVTGTEDIPSDLLKCVGELQLSKQQLKVKIGRQSRHPQTEAST